MQDNFRRRLRCNFPTWSEIFFTVRSLAQRIHYMLARNPEPPAINRQQKYPIDCVEQHTSESIRCTVNVTETTLDFNLFVDSDWTRLRSNPKKKQQPGDKQQLLWVRNTASCLLANPPNKQSGHQNVFTLIKWQDLPDNWKHWITRTSWKFARTKVLQTYSATPTKPLQLQLHRPQLSFWLKQLPVSPEAKTNSKCTPCTWVTREHAQPSEQLMVVLVLG